MTDAPHTADLGTRYRYRQEGAEAERERIVKLLEELDLGRCCFESHDLIAQIKGEEK